MFKWNYCDNGIEAYFSRNFLTVEKKNCIKKGGAQYNSNKSVSSFAEQGNSFSSRFALWHGHANNLIVVLLFWYCMVIEEIAIFLSRRTCEFGANEMQLHAKPLLILWLPAREQIVGFLSRISFVWNILKCEDGSQCKGTALLMVERAENSFWRYLERWQEDTWPR